MKIAVLGASGPTGRHLVTQALDRGHEVVALARSPEKIADLAAPRLTTAKVDVNDPVSVKEAVTGVDVLVSGLGVAKGGPEDTLTRGARAVADAGVPYVVWLSALGTGGSKPSAGPIWPGLMKMLMGKEIIDKERADEIVLAVGGASVHAGILTNGALAGNPTSLPAAQVRRGLLPGRIARATVAAVMLDEAQAAPSRRRTGILVASGT